MPQRERLSFFSCVLLCTALGSQVATAGDAAASVQSRSIEDRMLAIMDLIQEKHIDPPTRQEMVLSAVKSLYRAQQKPAARGLSERVSQLSTRSEFADYLRELRKEFDDVPDVETIMLNGSFQSVRGFVFLIDAKQAKVQSQLSANRYVGVGIALGISSAKYPTLTKVFHDGPGWKAGVKEGDEILKIDGRPTDGKPLADIVDELRGEEATDVTIVVQQGDQQPRTFTITRGKTFIPTIVGIKERAPGQWQYAMGDSSEIGYLRFTSIGPSTLHELRRAAAQLRDVSGLVLDLRSSSGLLHDVIMLADALLDGGVIGHVRYVDGTRTHEARPGQLFPDLPMAVLMDKDMGAGQVWLTAALQDHGRAVVVGEPNNGEIFVRSRLPVPGEESEVTLATGILYRRNGTPLNVLVDHRYQLPHLQIEDSPEQQPDQLTVSGSTPVESRHRYRIVKPDHIVLINDEQREPVRTGSLESEDRVLSKAMSVLRAAGVATLGAETGETRSPAG